MSEGDGTDLAVILIGMIAIYFIPAMCAIYRGCRGMVAIVALNALLGWTFLGWIVAFVWANAAPRD